MRSEWFFSARGKIVLVACLPLALGVGAAWLRFTSPYRGLSATISFDRSLEPRCVEAAAMKQHTAPRMTQPSVYEIELPFRRSSMSTKNEGAQLAVSGHHLEIEDTWFVNEDRCLVTDHRRLLRDEMNKLVEEVSTECNASVVRRECAGFSTECPFEE